MSYLEIYNEHIRDLLAPDNGTLDLRDDAKKGIHVAGLTEASTTSTKEVSCQMFNHFKVPFIQILITTGNAPAHARQQGADAGADGSEQDVEPEPRAPNGERAAVGQVQDDREGGRQNRHPVHDRPRRVREGSTNTGASAVLGSKQSFIGITPSS